jgi:hypothetical protein
MWMAVADAGPLLSMGGLLGESRSLLLGWYERSIFVLTSLNQ